MPVNPWEQGGKAGRRRLPRPARFLQPDRGARNIDERGGTIRTLTLSLLGAAALAAGVLLVRQQKEVKNDPPRVVPAGETVPAKLSLERIRSAGY